MGGAKRTSAGRTSAAVLGTDPPARSGAVATESLERIFEPFVIIFIQRRVEESYGPAFLLVERLRGEREASPAGEPVGWIGILVFWKDRKQRREPNRAPETVSRPLGPAKPRKVGHSRQCPGAGVLRRTRWCRKRDSNPRPPHYGLAVSGPE